MKQFFEVKIKKEIILSDGKVKTATEKYLVDAVTWAEAETRSCSEMEISNNNVFEITNIIPKKFTEVLETNGETFFSAKVVQIASEEGKEKKIVNTILLRSDSASEAFNALENAFASEDILPYEIERLEDLKVVDLWEHEV